MFPTSLLQEPFMGGHHMLFERGLPCLSKAGAERRRSHLGLRLALLLTTFVGLSLSQSSAAERAETAPAGAKKIRPYQLESVEVRGSSRLATEQLTSELALTPGRDLDDELVMSTRSRILGLGLFRSVLLSMRRGSAPGLAHLVIELEDDESVLGDWALGGDIGVTYGETQVQTVDPEAPPLGYRLGLIGRNFFHQMHRAAAYADIDGQGALREWHVAYGLPRFAAEDVQFDAEIVAVDPTRRYLNTLGFGGRGQGLWSRSIKGVGEFQYGIAMYVNRPQRFGMPGFPELIAGPKAGLMRETRLRSFVPGAGYFTSLSVLLAPVRTQHSVLELNAARTFSLFDFARLTLDTKALSIGLSGYSVRGEMRLDVPLGSLEKSTDEAAALFFRLRSGSDRYQDTRLVGSAGILGLRWHSAALIGEFALQVTKAPHELVKETRPLTRGMIEP